MSSGQMASAGPPGLHTSIIKVGLAGIMSGRICHGFMGRGQVFNRIAVVTDKQCLPVAVSTCSRIPWLHTASQSLPNRPFFTDCTPLSLKCASPQSARRVILRVAPALEQMGFRRCHCSRHFVAKQASYPGPLRRWPSTGGASLVRNPGYTIRPQGIDSLFVRGCLYM